MAATFEKVKHYGSFGSIRGDTLEVNEVRVDGAPPRLHIGRWTPDGQHKRFSGFVSAGQLADLWGLLENMKLDGGDK